MAALGRMLDRRRDIAPHISQRWFLVRGRSEIHPPGWVLPGRYDSAHCLSHAEGHVSACLVLQHLALGAFRTSAKLCSSNDGGCSDSGLELSSYESGVSRYPAIHVRLSEISTQTPGCIYGAHSMRFWAMVGCRQRA